MEINVQRNEDGTLTKDTYNRLSLVVGWGWNKGVKTEETLGLYGVNIHEYETAQVRSQTESFECLPKTWKRGGWLK